MISTEFINECKNRANSNRLGKIIINDSEIDITNSNNLQSFSIDSGCYVDGSIIGSVYSKCLNVKLIADTNNLIDKSIDAQIGVKYDDLSTEYINMGKYTIEHVNNEITANMSQITAYDYMHTNLDKPYVCGIDYSSGKITLKDLYGDVCVQLGLTPITLNFINNDIPILDNPFTNGEKNRTVLQTIAKISCSFIDIDVDTNQIDLCWLSTNGEPDYVFGENDYVDVNGGQAVCGPINCLILKNSQIDDENVTIKDDDSISKYGENSIEISEDYILYNAELRQQAITEIWNRVKGMKYVDCKLTTYYGKPFLKLGNKIRIYTSEKEYFDTYVLKHKFDYDGTFGSVIESPALTKQEIKTQQKTTLQELLKETQITVNKQKKYIEQLVRDIYEENGVINENFTKVYQDLVNIINSVQNAGGNNLIKNSVMFAYNNNNIPDEWEVLGDGTLNINSSPESMNAGGTSGHVFTLNNKTVKQRVYVKADSDAILNEQKTYYTFSTKIKKNVVGSCYVKISNENEEYLIEIPEGQESFYGDYEIRALLPKTGYYDIEFYGSENSDATFTDNMFSIGEYKSQWTQANGEIMNTQVNINVNGVIVKSSIYKGDYTIMSPLEFSGYSYINGIITKVFTLNKDTTLVEKLESRKEVKMLPIKIVPVTSGPRIGWAFVETNEGEML